MSPLKPCVIVTVKLKQDDAPICGNGIQKHGQTCAGLVRVGGTDACPDRAALGAAFDRIGNENRISEHAPESLTSNRKAVKPEQQT